MSTCGKCHNWNETEKGLGICTHSHAEPYLDIVNEITPACPWFIAQDAVDAFHAALADLTAKYATEEVDDPTAWGLLSWLADLSGKDPIT